MALAQVLRQTRNQGEMVAHTNKQPLFDSERHSPSLPFESEHLD